MRKCRRWKQIEKGRAKIKKELAAAKAERESDQGDMQKTCRENGKMQVKEPNSTTYIR